MDHQLIQDVNEIVIPIGHRLALGDHTRHRLDVEIKRPQNRERRIKVQLPDVGCGIIRVVGLTAEYIQVLAEHLLLEELLIVGLTEIRVEVIGQMRILAWARQHGGVTVRIVPVGADEFLINPIEAFGRPTSEADPLSREWVAEATLKPAPCFRLAIRELINPKPSEVRSANPFEVIHRTKDDPGAAEPSALWECKHVRAGIEFKVNAFAIERLEQ